MNTRITCTRKNDFSFARFSCETLWVRNKLDVNLMKSW